MKDNPSLLKKWLLVYVLFSLLILGLNYTTLNDLLGINSLDKTLGFILTKSFMTYLTFFMGTLFFYFKITRKTIGWCISTSILAFFISFILTFLFSTLSNQNSLISTITFDFLVLLINILFIFAGVYVEQHEQPKDWDETVLDDVEV